MIYALYGINGVYNFGCEAIVRGTTKFLKDIDGDAQIIYYSHNYDYDKKILKNLDIKIIDLEIKCSFFKRVINKLCRLFNIEFQFLFSDFNKMIRDCDYMVSIGGDIYTIPEYIRNKKRYSYLNNLVEVGKKVIKENKKIIVYGASIGPFGKNVHAINYYKKNLEKYDLIVCRENQSIRYLTSIGISNTLFLPDPAFNIKNNVASDGYEKKYIGINLSPLSIKELHGDITEETIISLATLINKIYLKFQQDILFIPHVISDNLIDDDLSFIKKILTYVDKNTENHIRIANYKKGFMGIKEELHLCEFVVSARMHCAINAICENVPTIFLSYSEKSKGMCRYIYGNDEWILNLKDSGFDTNLLLLMKKMKNEILELTIFLNNRNQSIKNEYIKSLTKIKGRIHDKKCEI